MILGKNRQCMIWLLLMTLFIFIQIDCTGLQKMNKGQFQASHSVKQQQIINNAQQQHLVLENIDEISQNRLLALQREIIMNEQMINLYKQRLQILYQLKKQLRSQLLMVKSKQFFISDEHEQPQQLNDGYQQGNAQVDKRRKRNTIDKNDQLQFSSSVQSKQRQYHQDSPFLVLINQHTLTTAKLSQHSIQQQQTSQQSASLTSTTENKNNKPKTLNQHLIIIPPFIINKQQLYVTLVDQLNDNDINRNNIQKNKKIKVCYNFSHATRLLFYSIEKDYNEGNKKRSSSNYQYGINDPYSHYQKRVLNLALEIKPNKIKTVKIISNKKYNNQSLSYQPVFQIQQQVTSYQSHQLINQNFQWHKALQFDNLIIGYDNTLIYIKGKDRKMQEINVNEKVLGLYSINQYKAVYITQKRVAILNVRSYSLSDEIRFQYYLGNRTLIKQKQQQQSKHSSNSQSQQQQLDILNDNQINPNNNNKNHKPYWQAPYSKQYQQIRAITIQRIQKTGQVLILLSNGDLLLYSNSKISSSVNIGGELMREFVYVRKQGEMINQQDSFKHDKSNQRNSNGNDMELTLTILPNYNHAIITSNKHNKFLVYNITIPHLTQNKNSNFFAFLAPKSTELTCSYWMAIEMNRVHQVSQVKDYGLFDYNSNDVDIQVVVRTGWNKNEQKQRQLIIYYSYIMQSSTFDDENKNIELQKRSQQQQQSLLQLTTQTITIQQHRLLLNLIDSNSMTTISSTNSQQSKSSYWWNVLMICMIVIGVVVFRKFRKGKKSSQQQQQELNRMYQLPEEYKANKSSKFYDKNKLKAAKLSKTLDSDQIYKPNTQKISINQQKQQAQYEDKIIYELQSYLQKQGQKLSKQQISQLIQQIQQTNDQQQQKQQQIIRPNSRMTRQPNDQNDSQNYNQEKAIGSKQRNDKNDKRRHLQQQGLRNSQMKNVNQLLKKKKKKD